MTAPPTRGLLNYTTCRICRESVGMSDDGTIDRHGTRTYDCPESGTRVGAVVALLEEIADMKKRSAKP